MTGSSELPCKRNIIVASSMPKVCRKTDDRLVARIRSMAADGTIESLSDRLGISYNTWRKLTAGEPLRASLLVRLETRLDALEALKPKA